MTKNFSDFIDPISLTQPTGSDIEYDARFIDIQTIVEGKPEQQYGEVIIEAQQPDWNAVERLCCQILSESKDIRVFCFYTQALTATYGLVGFKKGCEIIHANIVNYWEDLYPKLLDEDGEYDDFYRSGSIGLLLAATGIIKQVNEANLIYSASKKAYFPVKSVVSILTNNEDDSYPGGREKILEDLRVAYESEQEEIVSLKLALGHLENIEEVFKNNIQGITLDFSTIKKPLEVIDRLINHEITDGRAIQDDSSEPPSEATSTIREAPVYIENLENLKIKDRADVKIILEKLTLYFRLKEPSHPAPLFIERLQKLMDMNFYDILKNISPNSLNDLDLIIGKNNEDDEANSN